MNLDIWNTKKVFVFTWNESCLEVVSIAICVSLATHCSISIILCFYHTDQTNVYMVLFVYVSCRWFRICAKWSIVTLPISPRQRLCSVHKTGYSSTCKGHAFHQFNVIVLLKTSSYNIWTTIILFSFLIFLMNLWKAQKIHTHIHTYTSIHTYTHKHTQRDIR